MGPREGENCRVSQPVWKERIERIRSQAYKKLGSLCYCCGESMDVMLTIDHVNDDGRIERRMKGKSSGHVLYREVLKLDNPRRKFRLACWNCNLGRQRAGTEECPHKGEKNADQELGTGFRL